MTKVTSHAYVSLTMSKRRYFKTCWSIRKIDCFNFYRQHSTAADIPARSPMESLRPRAAWLFQRWGYGGLVFIVPYSLVFAVYTLLRPCLVITVVLHGTILPGTFYGIRHADRCCKGVGKSPSMRLPHRPKQFAQDRKPFKLGRFQVLVHVGLFHMVQFVLASSLGCLAAGRHTFSSDLVLVLTDWNSTSSFYCCSTGG